MAVSTCHRYASTDKKPHSRLRILRPRQLPLGLRLLLRQVRPGRDERRRNGSISFFIRHARPRAPAPAPPAPLHPCRLGPPAARLLPWNPPPVPHSVLRPRPHHRLPRL